MKRTNARSFTFDPAPPPRVVPLAARATVLLGTAGQQIGWVFLGLGLVAYWAFTLHADFAAFRFAFGEVRQATGRVTSVESTAYSFARTRHARRGLPRSSPHGIRQVGPRETVFAYYYSYTTPDGADRTCVSYGPGGRQDVGNVTAVEFLAADPAASRIKQLRTAPVAWYVGLPGVVFPGVGLCFVVPALRRGRRKIGLLSAGVLTRGTLKSKRKTAVTDNNRRVYRFIFEFTDGDGQTCEAVARTNRRRPLEDESTERILYDPSDPRRAVVLDTLADRLRIDEHGRLRGHRAEAVAALVLPLLTIAGHGAWVVIRHVQ